MFDAVYYYIKDGSFHSYKGGGVIKDVILYIKKYYN